MKRIVLVALAGAFVLGPACLAVCDEALPREDLARVLVGEADGSEPDWAAILWTLRHRQRRAGSDLQAVLPCSSVLRADTTRARQIMSLGTDAPEWGEHPLIRKKQWSDALAFVDAWARGDVRDPCPHALHWRGVNDTKPEGRVQVSCGSTKNEFFYMHGDKRHGSKPNIAGLSSSPVQRLR